MSTEQEKNVATAPAAVSELIAAKTYDPSAPSIFGKGKRSDRATFSRLFCSCESCPLRAKRECMRVASFSVACPYGKVLTETGPTQRAGSYYGWLSERKEQAKAAGGWMSTATSKLAFIGDYVYLPYSHMDMQEAVPFLRHSSVFITGIPLIPRTAWNLETVLSLIAFRPRSMMGGEITSYQTEQVPKFLAHLREVDSDMWAQLIAVRPELDTTPNYVGRKALLRTLAHPITIPPCNAKYPVTWQWNGSVLGTHDIDAYGSTWGHIEAKHMTLTITPTDDATVVVASNAWVTSETVFVD